MYTLNSGGHNMSKFFEKSKGIVTSDSAKLIGSGLLTGLGMVLAEPVCKLALTGSKSVIAYGKSLFIKKSK